MSMKLRGEGALKIVYSKDRMCSCLIHLTIFPLLLWDQSSKVQSAPRARNELTSFTRAPLLQQRGENSGHEEGEKSCGDVFNSWTW